MNSIMHDTVELTRLVDTPIARVWAAYSDVSTRVKWCVPEGEDIVYTHSDFRTGGRDHYRCGTPGSLEFDADVEYAQVVPESLIVFSETVRSGHSPLASSLSTWEFSGEGNRTLIRVSNQIVSFVDAQMIEGTRNGHVAVLGQLQAFLSEK